MTLSTIKQNIYSSLFVSENANDNSSNVKLDSMLNLIQATFIVVQSSLASDAKFNEKAMQEGKKIFHVLYMRYFQNLEVKYEL